jgi:hypothetical protein
MDFYDRKTMEFWNINIFKQKIQQKQSGKKAHQGEVNPKRGRISKFLDPRKSWTLYLSHRPVCIN